jgi:hypothetical protein
MLDITFDSIEHDGTTYPVDYATFENDYEDNKDPESMTDSNPRKSASIFSCCTCILYVAAVVC